VAIQRCRYSEVEHTGLVSSNVEHSLAPVPLDLPAGSITITGWVVLGGHTRVEDPHANFRNAFAGTTSNGNGIANALVKINFAYAGYTNAFNVVNETKVSRLPLVSREMRP